MDLIIINPTADCHFWPLHYVLPPILRPSITEVQAGTSEKSRTSGEYERIETQHSKDLGRLRMLPWLSPVRWPYIQSKYRNYQVLMRSEEG